MPGPVTGEDNSPGRRAGAVGAMVLAAGAEGLRFAGARVGAERERYAPDGGSDEWVDVRPASSPS